VRAVVYAITGFASRMLSVRQMERFGGLWSSTMTELWWG